MRPKQHHPTLLHDPESHLDVGAGLPQLPVAIPLSLQMRRTPTAPQTSEPPDIVIRSRQGAEATKP